ncbi:UDP-Glycosyltransferase/glycogen phosphorylase, partial [Neoconidiobolus thromboides FSU 785]
LKLFNTFHGLEVNRPLDQSVKMIGPIIRTSTQVQPLDKKIVKFLKLRKRIVYVSFGTIFYPPNSEFKKLLKGLLNLVEKGEIDGVIIANKYLLNNLSLLNIHSDLIEDTIDLLNHPAFLLVEYLNQKEILSQQQIKLFVSHGGLMSLFESIHYSKPMLLLPLSVDQPRNARKAVEMGIGIYMDPFNSELNEYSSNIMAIINDKDNTFNLSLKRANLLSKQNEN